tara:strand:+ start:4823 stop:5170 length:348 start_codon:yes stop_codon:yes gene_type:complete
MAITKIFEQLQSGGTACFLIVGGDTIDIGTGNDADLSDAVGNSQTVAITKMHWSGSVSITDGTVTIPLTGNGAWCQFNGWTPVECSDDIVITGAGTIFIEIKKLTGFTGRSDYSA